jgi:hypothetical protein
VLCLAGRAFAQAEMETVGTPPATESSTEHAEEMHLTYTHPQLPADARWAGVTTLIILGSFLAAAGVGIVVYQDKPAEEHAAHDDAHDEHGHGHHGHDAGGHH